MGGSQPKGFVPLADSFGEHWAPQQEFLPKCLIPMWKYLLCYLGSKKLPPQYMRWVLAIRIVPACERMPHRSVQSHRTEWVGHWQVSAPYCPNRDIFLLQRNTVLCLLPHTIILTENRTAPVCHKVRTEHALQTSCVQEQAVLGFLSLKPWSWGLEAPLCWSGKLLFLHRSIHRGLQLAATQKQGLAWGHTFMLWSLYILEPDGLY